MRIHVWSQNYYDEELDRLSRPGWKARVQRLPRPSMGELHQARGGSPRLAVAQER